MKKINLSISGCMGRMGQQLIKSSKKNRNFKLVSLTELRLNFASLYEEDIVIKNAETGNKEIIKLDELSITKEDVVVFSSIPLIKIRHVIWQTF